MRLRNSLAIVGTAIATTMLAAGAAVAGPVALPSGPLFIQYTNDEQFSATNAIVAPGGATEGNWGILQVSNIVVGTALSPLGSDIQGGGSNVFVNGFGPQVLGIFYGVQVDPANPTQATGGKLDLYWFNSSSQNTGTLLTSAAAAGARTAQDQYPNFTCAVNTANCTFLVELDFTNGVLGSGSPVDISTGVVPGSADGTAKSYLNVDTSKVGAWTTALNTNFFTLDPLNNPLVNPPDVRLDSNFTANGAAAWSVAGTNIVGLRSNDPARADAIPEPNPLVLLGTMLLGLGVFRWRSHKRG